MFNAKLATLVAIGAAMWPAASGACPPWFTIAHDVVPRSLPKISRGVVAGNLQATRRFSPWLLERDRRTVRTTNFRRFVLVAVLRAFPTSGHSIDIEDLSLASRRLVAHIALRNPAPDAGVLFEVTTAYEVVRVPRGAFGRQVPRSVAIVEEPG